MWYGKNRVAPVVAVTLSVLCVFDLNGLVAMSLSSLSSQLEKDKESGLRMEAVEGVQQLVEHNFLVGVASLGAFYENDTQCGQELEIMLNAIARHKVWGLKGVLYCVCVWCQFNFLCVYMNDKMHFHDQV